MFVFPLKSTRVKICLEPSFGLVKVRELSRALIVTEVLKVVPIKNNKEYDATQDTPPPYEQQKNTMQHKKISITGGNTDYMTNLLLTSPKGKTSNG
jgi:hypothetical protein